MGDRVFAAKLGFPESSKIIKVGEIFQSDHMRLKVYNVTTDYKVFDCGKLFIFVVRNSRDPTTKFHFFLHKSDLI